MEDGGSEDGGWRMEDGMEAGAMEEGVKDEGGWSQVSLDTQVSPDPLLVCVSRLT